MVGGEGDFIGVSHPSCGLDEMSSIFLVKFVIFHVLVWSVLLPPHVDTKVKWMRNEEVVKEGSHLHLLEEDEEGVYTLEIEETQITDSGIYEAEVSNQFGTVATRCKVDVDGRWLVFNFRGPRVC